MVISNKKDLFYFILFKQTLNNDTTKISNIKIIKKQALELNK